MAHSTAKQLLATALSTGDYTTAALIICAGALEAIDLYAPDDTIEEKAFTLRKVALQQLDRAYARTQT